MRRQQRFTDVAIFAQVHGRIRIALAVRLERDGDRVGAAAVDEVGQGKNPFVGDAVIRVQLDDPGQVGTLVPEFGPAAQLAE